MKQNIAVIFGGKSCEHDISILTATQILNAIDNQLYNVVPIYICCKGNMYTGEKLTDIQNFPLENFKGLQKVAFVQGSGYLHKKHILGFSKMLHIDSCIIALHGINGEDGAIAALLNLSNIPYCSSDICASSVCIDKSVCKVYLKGLGVNIVNGVDVCKDDFRNNPLEEMSRVMAVIDYPVVVKPNCGGSSIGISVCNDADELNQALHVVFKIDTLAVVEKYLTNFKEYNVAILGDCQNQTVSQIEEVFKADDILSFNNKYQNATYGLSGVKKEIPADISLALEQSIKEVAAKVFKSLRLSGVVRFDFIVLNEVLYLNEVNTIPGSYAGYLFANFDMSLTEIINKIISISTKKYLSKSDQIYYFKSGILHGSNVLKK